MYETSGMTVYKEVEGKLAIVAIFEHGMDDDIQTLLTNAELLEALEEIAKGEGAYSLDPLKHASNTIANMTRIAEAAIRNAKGESNE